MKLNAISDAVGSVAWRLNSSASLPPAGAWAAAAGAGAWPATAGAGA